MNCVQVNCVQMMFTIKIVVAFLMILSQESICLRVVDVVIPGYRIRGETAILECQYDLENGLYSVKWYKDNEEFYRYMPKFSPPQHSYRIDGIKVDHHLSDDKRVTLKGVTLKSSGLYRCEVSAEGPSFASGSGEGRMEVVYLPRDGPHISGQGSRKYQVGDVLNLNCTSGRSYPASILHWYVNDEKITNPKELIEYDPVMHKHGLLTASLGLKLSLLPGHLPGGSLRARCVAMVSPVLWTADQESLVERVAPLIDNREALLLVKSGSSSKVYGCNSKVIWISLIIILIRKLTPSANT